MTERRDVVKHGDKWAVRKSGADRASSLHDTQREANQRAPTNAAISAYQRQLTLPAKAGNYLLTVEQQLGSDWVALANTASATGKPNANGETIILK